jgi:hypothetical protein
MRRRLSIALILAGHFTIGVTLGIVLTLLLVAGNSAHVLDVIEHAPNPDALLTMLFGGFASTFGIGATITGFFFSQLERRW